MGFTVDQNNHVSFGLYTYVHIYRYLERALPEVWVNFREGDQLKFNAMWIIQCQQFS